MKRFFSIFCVLSIILLSFCGCKNSKSESDVSSEPAKNLASELQALAQIELDFDTENSLRFDIKDAELKDVFIVDSAAGLLQTDVYTRVYLLADDKGDKEATTAEHYLAIISGGKMSLKKLAKWKNQVGMAGEILLFDFDGDGDKEILLQETLSVLGGFGNYLSRVFDYRDKQLVEIFSSVNDKSERFDTGFSATILEDCKLKITNSITNYTETFDYKSTLTGSHPKNWYDENGAPKQIELLVDSFYEFTPMDLDGDGAFEIKCCQHTSLSADNAYLGTAVTVLKFKKDENKFVISSTSFEPANK